MPHITNCSLVHSGTEPGPCELCGTHDHTKRFVHMCQKKDRLPAYYKYVKEHHSIEDEDCICRKCDAKLTRDSRLLSDDFTPPTKRRSLELCDSAKELNVEKEIESESMIVCLSCYRSYNVFSKSTYFTLIHAQSDGFLVYCLQEFDEIDIKSVDVTNIDLFFFRMILAEVVNKFLTYKPLLLKSLYSEYCGQVSKLCNTLNISLNVDSENRTKHDIRWIFKMFKSCLGSALHYWVPEGLKTGRMVYRVGTDFMRCAHSQLHGHKKSIDELQAVNKALQIKLDDLSESLQAMKKIECLDETLKITRQCIKSYVSSSVNSSELPDIRCFDVHDEIRKLDPVLWNFIYRLTANEIEEKELRRDVFNSWENSYLGIDDSCLRLFPRLFIASCIFNAQSSKCGKPLHMLLSDVLDKYSGSSTELFAISNRLGATVSKESFRRFISSRCIQLDKEPNLLSSDSFTVASFDNFDKNQKSRYPDAFLSALPTETGLTAVILEGMFMINSNPAPQHKTFGDYAEFIFDRWIVRSYKQFSASEIHFVFDHPNSWWFDDDNRDKALGISSLHVGIVEFAQLSANHEEGDTRVWLHASQAAASRVVIYSPDTDTFFIGLHIVKSLRKSVFVPTKEILCKDPSNTTMPCCFYITL
ncbi:BCL6 [Mytilus edulis]|uniref:BCL6 n=1 Tax=Mytilus edulis TaxID=6550 RepID=A0A8S3R7X9_MYTED|nr:BCL6 [Mytilus edulis]